MRLYPHPNTANEWNSFLEKNYGYGLWEFADSISQFLISKPGLNYLYETRTQNKKDENQDFVEYLNERIIKIESLKRQIIETINEDLDRYDFWSAGKFSNFEKIRRIIIDYKLHPFFIELNKSTAINRRMLSRLPKKAKLGRPVHLRNQLASIWAQVIKDNRGSNWMVIELLGSWFFKNLEGAVYRKKLGDTIDDFNQFNLKNEYYRLKKKYMNYIIAGRNTFFPISKEIYRHRIEFRKEGVKLGNPDKILIIFPNGIIFPER